MSPLVFLLSCLLCVAHCLIRSPSPPVRLPNNPLSTSCPLLGEQTVRELVRETLDAYSPCSCGGAGGWTRVVHLNMSDIHQQCPSNWTLITTPVRGCGRTSNGSKVCDSITYPVHGLTYSHVCGRILAYQKGVLSAFYNHVWYQSTLEEAYLSGVSLTHGPPGSRQHIWSFVGGMYELDDGRNSAQKCPCSVADYPYNTPFFINNNYFCDSGNSGPSFSTSIYYSDNPLWDGQGCGSSSSCCQFNIPPWFCTTLPQATSDDLEVRNCYAVSASSEDKIITLIDIYVK